MLQGSMRGRGGYRIRQRDDDIPLCLAARVIRLVAAKTKILPSQHGQVPEPSTDIKSEDYK